MLRTLGLPLTLKRALTSLCLLSMVALSAGAGLPADGWPQGRRDAERSGRTPEPSLTQPLVMWFANTGAPLSGEPVVAGCRVVATNADGEVVAIDVGDGSTAWRAPRAWVVPPTTVESAIAVDDSGLVAAGLPGDPGIRFLWEIAEVIESAIESYAVDNGDFPPGPDLGPDLVPTYIAALPWNPLAGRRTVFSDTPSPGDYRYEYLGLRDYALAIWWADGKLRGGTVNCSRPTPPAWPLTPERGGSPTGLAVADGADRFTILDRAPATDLTPAVASDRLLWASAELTERAVHGRLRATDLAGVPQWERLTWGPLVGGVAHDPATGNLFVARGADRMSRVVDSMLRSLMTGVESYQVDNGFPPPTGDLEPILVPTFLYCMPRHPFEDRGTSYATTPSPGDYDYVYNAAMDTYEIVIWGEDGTPLAVGRDGGIVTQAVDRPAAVLSYDLAGGVRWQSVVGAGLADELTQVAVRPDGVPVVGSRAGDVIALDPADGRELWRTPIPGSLRAAPAVAADGSTLVVTDGGVLVKLDSTGGIAWTYPTGWPARAAPTVTADGIVYVPGLDGILRAVDDTGALAWSIPLGAALTTAAVAADGWVFVGDDAGTITALAPSATRGGPTALGNTLLLHRDADDVVLEWTPAAAGLPAACSHVVRASADPIRQPTDRLVADVPAATARDLGAVPLAPALIHYRVHPATCCGVEGP